MGWFSKAKSKLRPNFSYRHYRAHPYTRRSSGRRYGLKPSRRYRDYSPAYRYYKSPTRRRYHRKLMRANRRHKVVGLTPDYWVSPIDAIPVVGPAYSKGKKGTRAARYTRKKLKGGVETFKAGYRSRRRGRSKSSHTGRRRRRGTYYYYRGKRYYR